MYYGEIKTCDIANGIGVRVSIFVSGCRNHCFNCFQPETWDFKYGRLYTNETKQTILDMLSKAYIDGLTLLGGDPFEPENQKELLPLVREAKKLFPAKSIWAYTGYLFENLNSGNGHPCCEYTKEMLSCIDVLVDGPYIDELKNISLQFRGSSNQRIIDVVDSLKKNEIIIIPDKKRGDFYG